MVNEAAQGARRVLPTLWPVHMWSRRELKLELDVWQARLVSTRPPDDCHDRS